jgi:hypothetical protein
VAKIWLKSHEQLILIRGILQAYGDCKRTDSAKEVRNMVMVVHSRRSVFIGLFSVCVRPIILLLAKRSFNVMTGWGHQHAPSRVIGLRFCERLREIGRKHSRVRAQGHIKAPALFPRSLARPARPLV